MPLNGEVQTVLLVDDDPRILNLVRVTLQQAGLEVLSASTAAEAMTIESAFVGPIHLLLADLVMPDVVGLDLAKKLTVQRPDMCVILMSGYFSDGATLVLDLGWRFIQKPFLGRSLLKTVKETLARATPGQQREGSPRSKAAGGSLEPGGTLI